MRSKIAMTLAALTFALVGCEKRDTNTNSPSEYGGNRGHSDPANKTSSGTGGGPPTSVDDDNSYAGNDGGALSGDPQHGSESLSGGGSGESMTSDAGK